MLLSEPRDSSACGVGFVANRQGEASHHTLQHALQALCCVEHRGGYFADGITGDGSGIMTDIPFSMFGYERGSVAVGTLFILAPPVVRERLLGLFRDTFAFMGMEILSFRNVPINKDVLGPGGLEALPDIVQVFVKRPVFCRTEASFNKRLYLTRQRLKTIMKNAGLYQQFYFVSLSTTTIVYKGLTRAEELSALYEDLQNPAYQTRFGIFHRRFSTNTRSSWDKVQPFRLIAHNGEINTIAGNYSSAYSRQRTLGLPQDEVLTHENISDSGSLNEMVEALKYRSSMPNTEDVMAIMIPPARYEGSYYQFWGRAMEAWDGPAFVAYSDGESLGARMDRNGFRPCRWAMTEDAFYLASEAGVFQLDESKVLEKGALRAGDAVMMELETGEVHFRAPHCSRENERATLDARLEPFPANDLSHEPWTLDKKKLWLLDKELWSKMLLPMLLEGKEPIGSMGDTARLAILSEQPRSFFDYFYQNFAQVTNPPLDYLREKMVTDLQMHLGHQPNIFVPKELVPPMPSLLLESPLLGLKQLAYLRHLSVSESPPLGQRCVELDISFSRADGVSAFRSRLQALKEEALAAVEQEVKILVLTDRLADVDNPPLPSLLALRSVVCGLNTAGRRLEASIVVACGDLQTSHQLAATLAFGATAICPVLPLELARWQSHPKLDKLSSEQKEAHVHDALLSGLLKVMSKMGISVARSYRSAKLFTAVGIGADIIGTYFKGLKSPIGGLDLNGLAAQVLRWTRGAGEEGADFLPSRYWLKEHARQKMGEKHAMTAARSRLVHDLVALAPEDPQAGELYKEYLAVRQRDAPLHLRDLMLLKQAEVPLSLEATEPEAAIMKRFVSGAMSYGAISAESQRDLIHAMKIVGGRSNSGEGGENPYYMIDGTTASIKQVASGRFGVTAQYIAAGDEVELKMAQGAKPGEGGQLMAVKVDETIAKARHSMAGVDLISPPPMHDIYSIEDLKQLIYELKQLFPQKPVCVKLVSGTNIGTIAAGVVKAGADVIQISGGSGGTGAATLVSMKHAGLPWELGLAEVHKTLMIMGLRSQVKLRVDGGLSTGEDLVLASALGADEFGFGKLLLVAEGCIMARVCEKNTCPRGIATHDPRFLRKYVGGPEAIVRLLHHIAQDVRQHLALIGVRGLDELRGRMELLEANPAHAMLARERGIDLEELIKPPLPLLQEVERIYERRLTDLNERIVEDFVGREEEAQDLPLRYIIRSTDRGVLARLSGQLAYARHNAWSDHLQAHEGDAAGASFDPETPTGQFVFEGSAGQGFAVFLVEGLKVRLEGEANDSVCKAMSGGQVVIVPPSGSPIKPAESTIIGNCALYGATGGSLFVLGNAGDRFAVRNSGAQAVVESVGMHGCCYMTKGTVLVLQNLGYNAGSGMTGGKLYCRRSQAPMINSEYVKASELNPETYEELVAMLKAHAHHTNSGTANHLLEHPDEIQRDFVLYS